MEDRILDLNRVSVKRNGRWLLKDVSWHLRRGEHAAVLGANGSGKSTLFQVLLSYSPATQGEISVAGSTYGKSNWPEIRGKIGIVSNAVDRMIDCSLSARDIVITGAQATLNYLRPFTGKDWNKADALLTKVGCGRLAERPWPVLSQGERQRILIARALMPSPVILLLDEPCAGLDPVARREFLRFIDEYGRRRSAPTMIYVTHHIEEIVPVFETVLLLREGKVMASGRAQDCLTSAKLSRTFGAAMKVEKKRGRFSVAL